MIFAYHIKIKNGKKYAAIKKIFHYIIENKINIWPNSYVSTLMAYLQCNKQKLRNQ